MPGRGRQSTARPMEASVTQSTERLSLTAGQRRAGARLRARQRRPSVPVGQASGAGARHRARRARARRRLRHGPAGRAYRRSGRPDRHVLGVDPLPLRIELAQAKARPNLQFKVADAYDLSLHPDRRFRRRLPQRRVPLVAGKVRTAPRVCACPEARRATGHQQRRQGPPNALPGTRVGGVGAAAVQCLCTTTRRADPSRRRAGDAPVADGGRLRGEVDRSA